MTFQPAVVGFLVQRAEVLVWADLFGVLGADRRVAGAALPLLHLPIAFKRARSSTRAELPSASHAADDSNPAVGKLDVFAHGQFSRNFAMNSCMVRIMSSRWAEER